MLDAILMEQQGVPAVAIVTAAFSFTGRAMAESWGKPDYPFLEAPHPISHLTWGELDARADRLAEAVVEWLIHSPPGSSFSAATTTQTSGTHVRPGPRHQHDHERPAPPGP